MQKTAYDMRISDWSSDVCSSDLRWKADEAAYLDEWPLTAEQKEAVIARDYNRMLDLGGNIYFLSKIFSTDGISFAEAVSTMTDMSFPEYRGMMNNGGRSPRSEEHTSELQSLMRISYAVFCLNKK